MEIGKNISYYRKEKKLTQEELGEKLGVTNQAVSKWESETSMPDIALLPELAAALGISLDTLYGIDKPKDITSADDFPDAVYDELHKLFYRSVKMRFKYGGATDDEQIEHNINQLKDGCRMGCLSNTGGAVVITDSFSFIDRSYKLPESEIIFEENRIASVLKKLSDKNVRKVLEYEYRTAFEKSKADNTSFTADEISKACDLNEEETEAVLDVLCGLELNDAVRPTSASQNFIYYFRISEAVYALAIFKCAELLITDKVWHVVRDTSMISDYAFYK